MGILSDVFVASDAELASFRPGTGGPEGKFATVSGKGIDPLHLTTLEAIVTHHEMDTEQLLLNVQLVSDWGEQWVHRFSESLTAALAQVPPDALDQVAAAWAATDEFRLSGADTSAGRDALRHWISAVCELAQRARHEGRSLYLWNSL